MAHLDIKYNKALSPAILVLGLAYLFIGFVSIVNWCIGLADLGQQFCPDLIPSNLGFALVALTIGASLIASTYYSLRGDVVMHLASAACGTWLAVGALVIQVIVTIALVLDAIVVGEEVGYSIISENLLRMDVILGGVILPITIPYTLMLRKITKQSK